MDNLAGYLQEVYGESAVAEKAKIQIEGLIRHYRPLVDTSPYRLSEKDVVLTVHGDSIREMTHPPLTTLRKWVNEYLPGIVNSLHILPFHPYSSDAGFSVIDYKSVDTDLGAWQDVKALAGGYRLMFDAVINHVSESSEWFQRYLAGDPRFRNFFIDADPTADYSTVVRPRQAFDACPGADVAGVLPTRSAQRSRPWA